MSNHPTSASPRNLSSRPEPGSLTARRSGETPVFRAGFCSFSSPSFIRRYLSATFICLLAVLMLGADASSDTSARFGHLGHNMMCVCSCGQILLECNHVGCPDSSRMIGELHDQLAGPNSAGADSLILNWFVAKYGATVLAAPMRGGFDNVAWIVPIIVFLLAIFGTALLVRFWSQKHQPALASPTPQAQNRRDDPLRDRIRRETEY